MAEALAFSHIAMDASATQSVNVLETFHEYQFCSYNFQIFRFSLSGKGEVGVYSFMSKQS